MVTSITPVSRWASFSNVSSDRSISRPVATVGPRSSTLQVADAPFDTRVTSTTVPMARVRWANVPPGALNQDATPLSDLVTALLTAAAGGTTFSSRVVSGVTGAVVGAGTAGRLGGRVVDVGPGREVVVVAGLGLGLVVVVVDWGEVVEVVPLLPRASLASSAREAAAATGVTTVGGSGADEPGSTRAGESTRIDVDGSSDRFFTTKAPPASTTMHTTAVDSDRVLPIVGVSTFPAFSAADLDAGT